MKRTFKQVFLGKLKELGGEQNLVNNKILQTALEWEVERYTRIRDELVREKVIVFTRGGPGGAIVFVDSMKIEAGDK